MFSGWKPGSNGRALAEQMHGLHSNPSTMKQLYV